MISSNGWNWCRGCSGFVFNGGVWTGRATVIMWSLRFPTDSARYVSC